MTTNNKINLVSAIESAIRDMDDASAVCLWNDYCDMVNRFDDRIEDMSSLPELFCDVSGDELFNILNRFYFGHDENDEKSSANPNRDYFYFNGYGNIVSTDYPSDVIEYDELAEWIAENNDSLWNYEIQAILDEYQEESEEED